MAKSDDTIERHHEWESDIGGGQKFEKIVDIIEVLPLRERGEIERVSSGTDGWGRRKEGRGEGGGAGAA